MIEPIRAPGNGNGGNDDETTDMQRNTKALCHAGCARECGGDE